MCKHHSGKSPDDQQKPIAEQFRIACYFCDTDELRHFFSIYHITDKLLFHSSVAPSDFGNLTNFRLDPFNNDMRQLSFNMSIVDDSIPEDEETFNVSLTLDPADQARLGNRVTVSPDVATATIQDNDGKHT